VVIEDDRLTGRLLTRALKALGAETTVNAKQVHRQRLLAARRTQDDRVRGLGDLIRTYSKSVAEPDQMAAAMIGLPSPVLAASLQSLFCEAGATVETASAIVDKYMGAVTPEVLGGQALAAEVPAVLAAGDLRRLMEEPVRRTSEEDGESCAQQEHLLQADLGEQLKSELWKIILPDDPVEALQVIVSGRGLSRNCPEDQHRWQNRNVEIKIKIPGIPLKCKNSDLCKCHWIIRDEV